MAERPMPKPRTPDPALPNEAGKLPPRAESVVLPEVKILRLQPGDVLVAKLDDGARPEALDEIRRKLTERFPGHEVLLCVGLDLEVARHSDGDANA